MPTTQIQPYKKIIPMVYAYTLPGVPYRDGWTKIGYTEKQSVDERVKQQTHTAGVKPRIEWRENAMYSDGSGLYFTDHDFHSYLETQGGVERERDTEWFHVRPKEAHDLFHAFSQRNLADTEEPNQIYELRAEQDKAAAQTKEAFDAGVEQFLWNAKPRFGKTLTAYDLIQRAGY